MFLSPDDRRRAFSIWLRTGRMVIIKADDAVETKYNHRHDPRNGQFTYAGTGRHDGSWGGGGFTGGGGTFGGGGASETWSWPAPKPRKQRPSFRPTSSSVPAAAPPGLVVLGERPTLRRITRNGYSFDVDDAGRTRDVQGMIRRGSENLRSRREQRRAGQPDRRPTDDGGHFIAPRFNGPAEAFNHFAQDANFNRGTYRALEDQWAKAEKEKKKVNVRIMAFYQGSSKRPASIHVSYTIDGRFKELNLPNEQQGKPNGKR